MNRRFAAFALALALAAPAAARAESPYGINGHVPSAAALDRARDAGIGWVRADFNWVQMEPADNVYDWAPWDALVAAANARGLKVFATIAYTPAWANGGAGQQAPPTNPVKWSDFVSTCVNRYKASVQHWGMWNEPNLSGFFSGTRAQYIQDILLRGANAVKAACPTCKVLGPDLAHLQSGSWDSWLADVLDQGGGSLDIVTHHIYRGTSGEFFRELDGTKWPWEPAAVKAILNAHGAGSKDLWITETGVDTADHGEAAQAQFIVESLDGMVGRPWFKKMFFYELADDPNIADKWGIVRADLSPKQGWDAYRAYTLVNPDGLSSNLPPGGALYQAEALNHDVGRADAEGWSATTPLDPPGYLTFGPYEAGVIGGPKTATFRLQIDNVAAGSDVVARIDVHDATSNFVNVSREIRRNEFAAPFAYQDFALSFTSITTHAYEFRVYFTDAAYLRQDWVRLEDAGGAPPPPPPGCQAFPAR